MSQLSNNIHIPNYYDSLAESINLSICKYSKHNVCRVGLVIMLNVIGVGRGGGGQGASPP